MKILCSIALTSALAAGTAQAQEAEAPFIPGLTQQVAAQALAQPAHFPHGSQPVEVGRWEFRGNTFSARDFPPGSHMQHPGKRMGTLGLISYTPFVGARTLYSCRTNDHLDRFTSRYENCEGHIKEPYIPILGYIATSQIAGTVPLYRCIRGGFNPTWADHFDTVDVHCERQSHYTNEEILGYIWL